MTSRAGGGVITDTDLLPTPCVARMPVYIFHVDSQIYYFGILHSDRSSQFYTPGLTKTVVCAIACLVWCI